METNFKIHTEKVVSRGNRCRVIKKIEAPEIFNLPEKYVGGIPSADLNECSARTLRLCVSEDLSNEIRGMHIFKGSSPQPKNKCAHLFRMAEEETILEEEFQVFIGFLASAATRLREINLEIVQMEKSWKGEEVVLL